MWSILPLLSLSALLVPVQSLYFFIDGTTPKCFFEELPKDTLVVGHYSAEEFDNDLKMWKKHDGLTIGITVDVRTPFISSPKPSKTDTHPGSIRQRSPSHHPKRLLSRPLHFHRRRVGRPQDLLHAIVFVRRHGLAVCPASPGRRQADVGSGDWGDKRD